MVCVPGINAIVVGTLFSAHVYPYQEAESPHPVLHFAVNLNKPRLLIIWCARKCQLTALTALPQEVNPT